MNDIKKYCFTLIGNLKDTDLRHGATVFLTYERNLDRNMKDLRLDSAGISILILPKQIKAMDNTSEKILSEYKKELERRINPNKPPFEWEDIDNYNQRTRVFGGWIVKTFDYVLQSNPDSHMYMQPTNEERISTCFVPDPKWEWEI